ncbi:hypothetical protein [Streptomyces macrosporus]|uniref:Lipoprotein n=1 Tax=Streptomyces macrosporus TaxID=44032 RepID=A0ABN3K6N9_9ACTN
MRLTHRAVLGVTTLVTAVALSGCSGDGGGNDGAAGDRGRPSAVFQAIRTAVEKTGEARTAEVELTVSMPGVTGGETRMSGVLGWEPAVMDVTVTGGALGPGKGPDRTRMLLVDEVMYVHLGEEAGETFGVGPWVKTDFRAMAEKTGAEWPAESSVNGLLGMGRSPAHQMALLLDSPDIERIGEETVDGVVTEHYGGTLTMEEALEADSSSGRLASEEREEMLDAMEKAGVEGFDIEVWVDERDRPVRIDMEMDGPEGTIAVSQTYDDYGVPVSVEAPPADETTDLVEVFERLSGRDDEGIGGV